LDGRALVQSALWRDRVAADHRQYLRDDAELARVHGPAVSGETRVNADGMLDISRWGRPQHDGPALRALTLMRWTRDAVLPAQLAASLETLLRADLAYVHRFAPEPCFDIWEEDIGLHYYTLRVSGAALLQGAQWLESQPARTPRDVELARACREKSRALITLLNDFWLPEQGHYRSRRLPGGARSAKELDVSVILAAVHAGEREGPHTPQDEHQQATLERLCALFSAAYPINRASPGIGPAMGRYADDRYYSGGAWHLATLGAAEFCYLSGDRARGRLPRDGAALHTAKRGALRAVRSAQRRADFSETTGLELRGLHQLPRRAPGKPERLAWHRSGARRISHGRGAHPGAHTHGVVDHQRLGALAVELSERHGSGGGVALHEIHAQSAQQPLLRGDLDLLGHGENAGHARDLCHACHAHLICTMIGQALREATIDLRKPYTGQAQNFREFVVERDVIDHQSGTEGLNPAAQAVQADTVLAPEALIGFEGQQRRWDCRLVEAQFDEAQEVRIGQ